MKIIDKYKKIVIKIGSSSIIDPATKKIRSSWITSFCKDISKINKKGFQIWVIPHTYKMTNLSTLRKESLVNIEIDIFAKYIERFISAKQG